MTTLPEPPNDIPPLWASVTSTSLPDALRSAKDAATAVSDWAIEGGAPANWTGDASEVASHQMTTYGLDCAVSSAALLRAAVACEAYIETLAGLRTTHGTLHDRSDLLYSRRAALSERIATEDAAALTTGGPEPRQGPGPTTATLAKEGTQDTTEFNTDLAQWERDVVTAEDAIIAVLEANDTVAETRQSIAPLGPSDVNLLNVAVAAGRLPADLQGKSAEEIDEWLRNHPETATDLMANQPRAYASGPEGELAALLATNDPNNPVGAPNIDAVRLFFESLNPAHAAALALLFPAVIGNLGGVPFSYRADANRVAVIAEAEIVNKEIRNLDATERYDGEIAEAQRRATLYQDILDNDRQIIVFDPAEDGKIAEVHGNIDTSTENVGVHIPGTGNDMSTFFRTADKSEESLKIATSDLAMISWLGTDLPDDVIQDAPSPDYATEGGPQLAAFSHELRQELDHAGASTQADVTYVPHSYAGSLIGAAETQGLDADRIFHAESAGTGPGVFNMGDLPPSQDHIQRYSMTAPDSPIAFWSQGKAVHGADPDLFEGSIQVHSGNYKDRTPIQGNPAHSGIYAEGSDSWTQINRVINGDPVELWREPIKSPDNPPGFLDGPVTDWEPSNGFIPTDKDELE